MSIYANGLNIQLNEVAFLTFKETTQLGEISVCQVAITYDILKQMHEVMGQAIEQHDAKLHDLVRNKENMN